MEVVTNNHHPGDSRLVDKIVYELKSQGIFDQFRKECIADVDTKPAYQNLRQRVEGSVAGFLSKQTWNPDMNKNQVREMLRKNIHESGFLEIGVERIVDQVVNPKINSVFHPKVEEVVYKFLGIEKPTRYDIRKEPPKVAVSHIDLLPNDLEAVSPESVTLDKDDSNIDSQDLDDSKADEDESPPFEPIEGQAQSCTTSVLQQEDQTMGSSDSRMSGISGLAIQDSSNGHKVIPMDVCTQDSQMSLVDSETRLSGVTDESAKMEICDSPEENPKEIEKMDVTSEDQGSSDKSLQFNAEKSLSQDSVYKKQEETFKVEGNRKAEEKKSEDKVDGVKKSDDKEHKSSKTDKDKHRSDDSKSSRHKSSSSERHRSKHDKDKDEKKSKDKERDRSSKHSKENSKESKDSKAKSEKDKDARSEKSEKDKNDRHKSDKEKSGSEKSEKHKSDKEKGDSHKSDKHRSDKEKHDKNKHKSDKDKNESEKHRSKEKSDKDKDRSDKEKEKSSKNKSEKDKERKEKEKSEKHKTDKDKSEKSEKDRSDKHKSERDKSKSDRENSEKDKAEKPEKSDKSEKYEKADKEKYDKIDKTQKSEKGDKTEKPEKNDKSEKDKADKEKVKTEKDRNDKDKKERKHSSSSRPSSTSGRDKSSSRKEKESTKDKEKTKSSSVGKTNDKSHGDSKAKNDSKSKDEVKSKGDHKVKSSLKKDEKHSNHKKNKEKKKDKDDHYSAKEKKHDRRSTDRDSNDGHSGKHNHHSPGGGDNRQTYKSSQDSFKSSQDSTSSSGSGESGNSDSVEGSKIEKKSPENIENIKSVISPSKDLHTVKLIKPKFASNMQEARRIMKIRKQLSKLEKDGQLALSKVAAVPSVFAAPVKNVENTDKISSKVHEKKEKSNVPSQNNGQINLQEKNGTKKKSHDLVKQTTADLIHKLNHKQIREKLKAKLKSKNNIVKDTTKSIIKNKQNSVVKSKLKNVIKTKWNNAVKNKMKIDTKSENILNTENERQKLESRTPPPISSPKQDKVSSPEIDYVTPPLKDTIITMESWNALEAKLNQELLHVNYDSYECPELDYSISPVKFDNIPLLKKDISPDNKKAISFDSTDEMSSSREVKSDVVKENTEAALCSSETVESGAVESSVVIEKKSIEEELKDGNQEEKEEGEMKSNKGDAQDYLEQMKKNLKNLVVNIEAKVIPQDALEVKSSDSIVTGCAKVVLPEEDRDNIPHETKADQETSETPHSPKYVKNNNRVKDNISSKASLEISPNDEQAGTNESDEKRLRTPKKDAQVKTDLCSVRTRRKSSASKSSEYVETHTELSVENTDELAEKTPKKVSKNRRKSTLVDSEVSRSEDDKNMEINTEILRKDQVTGKTGNRVTKIMKSPPKTRRSKICDLTESIEICRTEDNKNMEVDAVHSVSIEKTKFAENNPNIINALKECEEPERMLENKSTDDSQKPVVLSDRIDITDAGIIGLDDTDGECRFFESRGEHPDLYLEMLRRKIQSMEEFISRQQELITRLNVGDGNSPKKRGRKRKRPEDNDVANNNTKKKCTDENVGDMKITTRRRASSKANNAQTSSSSDVSLNDSFSLELSPVENVDSTDVKRDSSEILSKKRKNNKVGNQRYTNADLYKPRPNFAISRRSKGDSCNNSS